tara:strand:+ start:124 stop:909 length:786 start_codon:yes stop_codon:yes gene_type:complete
VAIEASARAEIERRLENIRREEGITYLLAVESGSRAWGFPSPNSDYDVRFFYRRTAPEYLSLQPKRDVVERPIVDDFDANGWDISKVLGLMLKHNATVSEWLDSPIRYLPDAPVIARLRALVDRYFNPHGYALHYAKLAQNQVDRWVEGETTVPAKSCFYALRPALCIRALRFQPERRPPMRLQDLMGATDLDPELVRIIEELIALKAQAREKAPTHRSAKLEALITEELQRAHEVPERRDDATFASEVDRFFVELVLEGN